MTTPLLIRIQRIRQRYRSSCTASASAIGPDGEVVAGATRYAVTMSDRVAPCEVMQGQWWRVDGVCSPVRYVVDGFEISETRVVVAHAELVRPSGEHIVLFLSSSPAFPGIGEVRARRLWEKLGNQLYDALELENRNPIAEVIGDDLAAVLIAGWREFGAADAVRMLQAVGLDLRLSKKLLAAYGREAHLRIKEDPYRLLAFGMTWRAVDTLAQDHFGITARDDRRLAAAIEAVLYEAFDHGDTCLKRSRVAAMAARLLEHDLIDEAIRHAEARGIMVSRGDRVHACGPYLLERGVAESLRLRISRHETLTTSSSADAIIQEFEQLERDGGAGAEFELTSAQRDAVRGASLHPLLLVTGGAGVGKTTVLKAICHLLDTVGRPSHLMALSGRAAKRMTEAVGRRATTIAGFINNTSRTAVEANAVLVVDESSMLDVLLAHRLFMCVPDEVRVILIGDPHQLAPVGPGLTLHALTGINAIPRVHLTEVRRFGGSIALSADAIREGRFPDVPSDADAPTAFIDADGMASQATVLEHYLRDPARTQILTFTKRRGPVSASTLNRLCQEAVCAHHERLLTWSIENQRLEDSGFRIGDPVICTRNMWDRGLQNGSMGRIEKLEAEPTPVFDSKGRSLGYAVAWVLWDDGELRPVDEEVLDALELGYAITVHKAQGSQYHRVIVPVQPARNLDRTMLYTAVTRATTQVLMIGRRDVARRAVENLPHASHREVALGEFVQGMC